MMKNCYECVGVGCGPSNLSVAALLHANTEIRSIFFEKRSEFSWHPGMMFSGSELQVSQFKDLVTLADPTNRFSFISYLHTHDRLHQFLNAQFAHISRREFASYLKWAAQTNENIQFGEPVLDIDFDGRFFSVETSQRRVLAKNVVVGVGIDSHVPEFARPYLNEATHFHIHEFESRPRILGGRRVIVVGGGQSGAEAILELLRRDGADAPRQIVWLSRRENFLPLDDSPFVNDFFTPAHSNYFYNSSPAFRDGFLKRNILASDGISAQTLREIYQRIYLMRYVYHSPIDIKLMPGRDACKIQRVDNDWYLGARHLGSGKFENYHADVIIWASGFRSASMPFLRKLKKRLQHEDDEIRIDKDYAAIWDAPSDRSLLILNASRRQRGLADPNLSLTAWRSQIVIDRILGRPRQFPAPNDAFVTWAATARQPEAATVDALGE